MIRNYDEKALLESSGIALLFNLSRVAYTHICNVLPTLVSLVHAFLPQFSITHFTPSTPAFQMHCQFPTPDLLLNSFGVELLFREAP